MLEAVIIVAMLLALGCLGTAGLDVYARSKAVRARCRERHGDGQKAEANDKRLGWGDEVTAAILAAVILVIVAAAAAAIDEKVTNARSQTESSAAAPPGIGVLTTRDLEAFRPRISIHQGTLQNDLCLTQYYDRTNKERTRAWWTSCKVAKQLGSEAEVRSELALPKAWGERDARIEAHIPVGQKLTFMRGYAAPQCGEQRTDCYDGGGLQFRLTRFNDAWLGKEECWDGRTWAKQNCP
jgi:hypothetical protein